MKRILLMLIVFIFMNGCFSSERKNEAVDTKSGASPKWEISADLKKYVEGKKMKYGSVLIVYFSRTGNTEKVAYKIAPVLNGDIEKIVDLKPASYMGEGFAAAIGRKTEIRKPEKNPKDYDLVIIGTPIWAWKMTPAVRTYIEMYRDSFKNVAFFTTSGGTAPDKIVKSMEELSGKEGVGFFGVLEGDLKDQKVLSEKIGTFMKLFVE